MEKNTKIFIGVGAAALIAFLLLSNKSAAKTTTGTASGGGKPIKDPLPPSDGSGGTASGGGKPIKDPLPPSDGSGGSTSPKTCPEGQVLIQLRCIKAPCPAACFPVGGSNGTGIDFPNDPCMTARLSCTEGFVAKNVYGVCRCVVDDTVLVLDPPALGDYSGIPDGGKPIKDPLPPSDGSYGYGSFGKGGVVDVYL